MGMPRKHKYQVGSYGWSREYAAITLTEIKRRIKAGEPRSFFVKKGWLPS